MGDFVNKRHFTIDWAYCDPAGIVFNSRFFEFFDTSSWHLFEAALGVKPHKMAETFEILGVPLVDARAKFMVPAKFGDVVEMHSYHRRVPPLELRGPPPDFRGRATRRRRLGNKGLGGAGSGHRPIENQADSGRSDGEIQDALSGRPHY